MERVEGTLTRNFDMTGNALDRKTNRLYMAYVLYRKERLVEGDFYIQTLQNNTFRHVPHDSDVHPPTKHPYTASRRPNKLRHVR